jgi:parvulin-like peptidyl-prolyl isomerase
LLMAFVVVVVLLIVAIPAYGYYDAFVEPPGRTILTVNGVEHTLGEVAKVTQATVATMVSQGQTPEMSTLPFEVFINLVDEELIRQAAPQLDIFVTQDDVDAGLRETYYPQPPAGEQTDPDALELEFEENYRRYLTLTGFTDQENRERLRISILRQRIQDMLKEQVPFVEEQVYAHWFRLKNDDQIEEVSQRTADGEAFDTMARIYGAADRFADDDGVVGWVPRGANPGLDAVLFSIERNTISEPLTTQRGVYVIMITDGPEIREISEEMRTALQVEAMSLWLTQQRAENDITGSFPSPAYQWVIDQVRELLPAGP